MKLSIIFRLQSLLPHGVMLSEFDRNADWSIIIHWNKWAPLNIIWTYYVIEFISSLIDYTEFIVRRNNFISILSSRWLCLSGVIHIIPMEIRVVAYCKSIETNYLLRLCFLLNLSKKKSEFVEQQRKTLSRLYFIRKSLFSKSVRFKRNCKLFEIEIDV